MFDLTLAFDLLVATLVGLAVGTEREWSGHTTGPDGRFAGVRTFALLGALGGFAGWFFRDDVPLAGAALLTAGLLFPIAAYVSAMRRVGTSTDSTTEVSAILVVAMGCAAGLGHRVVASAAAALVVALLSEKSTFQRMLQRVGSVEMRAAVQFAVLALVVLPLLPDGSYGPYDAFRPRALWVVVLLFSGLNFAGYVARRLIGETRGLAVTGLLGGLVSSTAVTLNFSRRSRDDAALAPSLALGVIAACTVLLPRIALVSAVLRPAVALAVLPVLAPPFVLGSLLVARAIFWPGQRDRIGALGTDDAASTKARPPSGSVSPAPPRVAAEPAQSTTAVAPDATPNPLGLASSLQMALAFQLVLFVIAFMQQRIGSTGVLVSATLLGLTDMDALTVSMTRLGSDPSMTHVAAQAIGIGVLSNTALKIGLALSLGTGEYRLRVAGGLGALAAASAIGLWFAWT